AAPGAGRHGPLAIRRWPLGVGARSDPGLRLSATLSRGERTIGGECKAETETLKVGDTAPDFELPASPMGEKFKLSDYRGTNAVILNFVPSAFSGVCSGQLPVIEEKRKEFEAQAAIPVVISCDN